MYVVTSNIMTLMSHIARVTQQRQHVIICPSWNSFNIHVFDCHFWALHEEHLWI